MPAENPWYVMTEVLIPKPEGSSHTIQPVYVNGKKYIVPVGEAVEVPQPVAEAVNNMLASLEEVKEERPVSGGGGGGIPTAIIKNTNYDNVLAGIATAVSAPAASYACENMTFDEAMSILMSGKPLMALIMDVAGEAPMVGVAYYAMLDVWGESPCIKLGWDTNLYWAADGFSTSDSNGGDM